MSIDSLKRNIIEFFESVLHTKNFPKNYFAVALAILVEQRDITQDRIIELTGYSKTTISQITNQIQMNFPLNIFKKPKNRKKYYSISVSVREFMLLIFDAISKTYRGKMEFAIPIIKDSEPFIQKHPKFQILDQID